MFTPRETAVSRKASENLLQRALSHHQAGQLAQAEPLYRQILATEPRHFDAQHMLGVIRHQQGRTAEALDLVAAALKVNPESVRGLSNYGLILLTLGRHDEALLAFDKALMIQPDFIDALGNRTNMLYRLGRHAEALPSFDRLLALRPDDAPGFFLRGNVLAKLGRPPDALASYDRALKIRPGYPEALNNRGNVLEELKRFDDALASYGKALALKPDFPEALSNRGDALSALGRHDEAMANFDRALALRPDFADAHNSRGGTLAALKRHEEALASFERALAAQPDHAEALNNRGNALSELKRHEEALASYDRALAIRPGYAEAHYDRGNALSALKRYEEALASYDKALAVFPGYAEAYDNSGNALMQLNRHEDALLRFERALALAPANAGAFNNRGSAFSALKRHEDALASYDRALALRPDFVDAISNRGNVLKDLKRYDQSIACYEQALALDPEHIDASVGLAEVALSVCDWARTTVLAGELEARVAAEKPTVAPFTLLAYCDDPALHLQCARTFVADRIPVMPKPLWTGGPMRRDKIRVAYLSADFHRHATAYLIAELFELHDRSRFEIVGVSFDWDDGSEVRRRLVKAFDHFHDVRTKSDREVAHLLHGSGVDIAIDLKGYTGDSRLGIFAHRPAPIQASYLGYPGTIGADFMDYIIADPVVTPFEHAPFYSEKIVQLPDCYQVNDRKRKIAERIPTREAAGLPPQGFVFCCFNNNYKIAPAVFDVWMRLLLAVPGSVLWLLADNAAAEANLRREARTRGVDPARLVFAGRCNLDEHLARHRLADLFLDTLPYNAHTTASDTLWAGVPIVTCRGSAFAGRVSASLLRAAGLAELVTHSLADYEALALRLATDAGLIGRYRDRLAGSLPACALFDTDRFRRHLEAAYVTMWETWQRGEDPRAFAVEAQS
ncbi:MAG: protein O-GlcNAc transferase [Alphaproteobacteria bacterium]|jgi:predicted O-linked N-acetylglucosamine transferase (SPINDLY family)|nr:protein O-GlcNAc transferase [Alphaproteobacteria bacterium]